MKEETYTLELSEESFRKLAQKFYNMPNKFESIKAKILKKLATYTKERIQSYISEQTGKTGYSPTGDLLNSIMISDIFNDTIEVYTENAYANIVEYGSGIYNASSAKTTGWVYKDEKKGEWFYTEGQEAKQFMYKAFQDLEANYMQLAEQVFYEEDLL